MNKIERILARVQERNDTEIGNPATEDEICRAEDVLSIRLPEVYRVFLRKLGWAEIGHHSLYGLGLGIPNYLDLVRAVNDERSLAEPAIPRHLVPILNDGAGNHFCIDTARTEGDACPVVFWDHELGEGQEPDYVSSDFASWLESMLDDLEESPS